MLTIGIDPDLHDLAVGVWRDGRPDSARVIHVPKTRGIIQHNAVLQMVAAMDHGFDDLEAVYQDDPFRIAVEAQTLARMGPKQHKRPQDIVILGNVAGAALLASRYFFPRALLCFPTPEQWKGQIPKAVMQARLYDELGWGYEMFASGSYAVPLRPTAVFSNITHGQWKHVGDALLLAKWAYERK